MQIISGAHTSPIQWLPGLIPEVNEWGRTSTPSLRHHVPFRGSCAGSWRRFVGHILFAFKHSEVPEQIAVVLQVKGSASPN
jgi:hypothetical protein